MRDAVIVEDLSKRFRRYHLDKPGTLHEALLRGFRKLKSSEFFWGLRDINFRLAPGRMLGVVGRNGAGKSTLLRLVGGVGRPDRGRIQVRGRIGGLLSLGAGFDPELTGRENLFVNGIIGGLTRQEVEACVDSIIGFSELEDYMDTPLRAYSTGMQMRLAFSIAIHSQPDVLLIDELLAVGDLAFQRKCLDRIARLKAGGCAILLVSHDVSVIEELCDEALWLRAGVVAAHGSAGEVVEKYVAEAEARTWSHHATAHPLAKGSQAEIPEIAAPESPLPELKITRVRLLDPQGGFRGEISGGDPLGVEICYLASQPIEAVNVQIYIYREDGAPCCDMRMQTAVPGPAGGETEGRILLHLEQLDLNGGLYYVDAGAFNPDWSHAYDYRQKIRSLKVRPNGLSIGVLLPPHRWEIAPVPLREDESSALDATVVVPREE